MRLFRDDAGMTLVEIMISVGIMGIVAAAFSVLVTQTFSQTKFVQTKIATIDLENSMKLLLSNRDICVCNFKSVTIDPKNIPAAGYAIGEISAYADSLCTPATKRQLASVGTNIPGTDLGVTSIELKNPMITASAGLLADLEVRFDQPTGPTMKPILLRNVSFGTTPDKTFPNLRKIASCGNPSYEPTLCGQGKVCIGDKSVQFTNENNAPVVASINSVNPDGFSIEFNTPSGRRAMFDFKVVGNNLTATAPTNWKPQFCYNHSPNIPPCQIGNFLGLTEYNCGSALKWTGDYTGSTISQKLCP